MLQGIIIKNISNKFFVKCNNKIYECNARGKLKNDSITPVVGDRVLFEIIDEKKEEAVIVEIKERTNCLRRPKVSNITQIVLILSANMPKPDLNLLDMQLAIAEYYKITPIVVINKIDLDKDIADEIEKEYSNIGYKVIKTVAKENEGIDEIRKILRNNISVFSGNSGVGKSTIINKIFNTNITQEGEISLKNKRGKNTTTQVSLYEINEKSYIVDTPGFSTLEINEVESENLQFYFKEFTKFINNCEYIGCSHIKEEQCGIKEAVKLHNISIGRYERYKIMYETLKEKEKHKW